MTDAPLKLDLTALKREAAATPPARQLGKLRGIRGPVLTCSLPAAVGDLCEIRLPTGQSVTGEVIGFNEGTCSVMTYEPVLDLSPGLPVIRRGVGPTVAVGEGLLGRVLDGIGRPIDGRGRLRLHTRWPVYRNTPSPLERARVDRPFPTGQRCVDGLLTLGIGQRVGIFAGSGVGKSTLLGEIAKGAASDVNVIALIGERGREVRPFIEDNLGPEGMKKSVVIVATCDQTPLMRVRAGRTAVAIADYFRRQGSHVLFMLDSLTRLAMAQREIGISQQEPPSTRGYTPSVFQLLADLVESLGNADVGSVTGILTVLVEGDDFEEPIADAVRSLVDGHIVLERHLAERGHFPAISVAKSMSRVAADVVDDEHRRAAMKIRAALAAYAEVEEMLSIGAYVKGSIPEADKAIEMQPAIRRFLQQEVNERSPFEATRAALLELARQWPF